MAGIHDYISNTDQLIQLNRFIYSEGLAKGVAACRVDNGLLNLTVLLDRGMDIYDLKFNGQLISYLSAPGVVHPAYYDPSGDEWLRTFGGGFLTTCGLNQVGEPCTHRGRPYGLHGRIGNLPAKDIRCHVQRTKDGAAAEICGTVAQAKQQVEHLELKRSIRMEYGKAVLTIEDEIKNCSAEPSPFMILYHFNFGFPFLNPATRLFLPPARTAGWDEDSHGRLHECRRFAEPGVLRELTLLHELLQETPDVSLLITDGRETGVKIRYDAAKLPVLGQWKHFKKNDYVMALEPCNNHIRGIAWEEENHTLETLAPGEARKFFIEIGFLQGHELREEILKTEKEQLL